MHQVILQIPPIPWLFTQGKPRMGLGAYVFVPKAQKFPDVSLPLNQSPALLLPTSFSSSTGMGNPRRVPRVSRRKQNMAQGLLGQSCFGGWGSYSTLLGQEAQDSLAQRPARGGAWQVFISMSPPLKASLGDPPSLLPSPSPSTSPATSRLCSTQPCSAGLGWVSHPRAEGGKHKAQKITWQDWKQNQAKLLLGQCGHSVPFQCLQRWKTNPVHVEKQQMLDAYSEMCSCKANKWKNF